MKELVNKLKGKLEGLNLDNRKLLLIAIVSFFLLYVDFAFIMKMQLSGIRALTPKISKMRKELISLSKELPRLQDLELREGKDKAGALKEIASEEKILLLLQEISDLANNNRIKITQINTAKDPKAKEEIIAGERLLLLTIKLALVCDYHSLGSFLKALEDARYFIGVEDMKIMRDPKNYLIENVNLTLKTYARK